MNKFYEYFLNAGFIRSIVIVTIASVLLSLLFTYLVISLIFGNAQPDMPNYLIVAAIVPLIVAPLASGSLLKLLFKVNALEEETRYLATYDGLTGLYTRRSFYEHAEQQLKVAQRESKNIAMLVADLDGFKGINDAFGHHAGDLALTFVSKVIKETIRSNDIVGRVGGDEFIFCLPNASRDEAMKLGARLVENVTNAAFVYDNNLIKLSLSVGMCSSEKEHNKQIDIFIKEADLALYRAKKQEKINLQNKTLAIQLDYI
jgi:diguanylate cyclase (GGDEF)-like protein